MTTQNQVREGPPVHIQPSHESTQAYTMDLLVVLHAVQESFLEVRTLILHADHHAFKS